MTLIPYTILQGTPLDGNVWAEWSDLVGDNKGAWFPYGSYTDKTVQVFGTIDAAVTMEGTNDKRALSDPENAAAVTLTDNLGNAIVFNAAGGALIADGYQYIRPSCASGLTSATVAIAANKS